MATLQYGVAARDAQNDALETSIGAAPLLQIFTGAMPANAAAADTGTKIVDFALPSDWLAASSAGAKTKLGTWVTTGLAGAGAGSNAGYFRIKNAAGTVVGIQGDITVTGGGGAMTLDNISIANGQSVTINTFTVTRNNA
jgi:hypothetical protein